jgi:hypothetical protein
MRRNAQLLFCATAEPLREGWGLRQFTVSVTDALVTEP